MKPRIVIAVFAVLVVAAVCVRLGVWQLSRLAEKRAHNAAMRVALAEPPLALGERPLPLEAVRARRVVARGRYDETRQVLLSGRAHAGSPGVHVVTPLVLADPGSAVLVDRGWVYAPDAATAHPQEHAEPGAREVLGMAQPLARGAGGRALVALESDSVTLWSAGTLDADSLASRFPYALAPYVLRQLPAAGLPAIPVRESPQPLDEMMHLSYAVQWFFFAAVALVGPLILARARRRAAKDPFVVPPAPGE